MPMIDTTEPILNPGHLYIISMVYSPLPFKLIPMNESSSRLIDPICILPTYIAMILVPTFFTFAIR